jgi:serine/threonine protein kinase
MMLKIGTQLGPYEILSAIGAGGMGEVWKARDTRLGRIVAIKQVKEQHSERFKQQVHAIATLNHPYRCLFHRRRRYCNAGFVSAISLSAHLKMRP